MFPKPVRYENKEYRAWLRTQTCVVRPCIQDGFLTAIIDPHHLVKHDDRTCVPMCRKHHTLWHDMPEDKFIPIFGATKEEVKYHLLILAKEYFSRWTNGEYHSRLH